MNSLGAKLGLMLRTTPNAELASLIGDLIRADGAARTARFLGVTPMTAIRVAAGLPVRAGSMVMVTHALKVVLHPPECAA